ncbi:hypothetical protein [Phascolarctobacterium faecium]|jgi:hypothetical protein|uniref:hypothetical protein n=1 Tax=Phascolarctobacterium faecium TaxID=33025 RepID=UPI002056EB90|nr:MAG TPA: hypothetical protein [Caudoviricetes sp.]
MEEVNDLNNNMNEEQPAEPVQEQQKETEPALEIEKEPEQEPASEQGKQPEKADDKPDQTVDETFVKSEIIERLGDLATPEIVAECTKELNAIGITDPEMAKKALDYVCNARANFMTANTEEALKHFGATFDNVTPEYQKAISEANVTMNALESKIPGLKQVIDMAGIQGNIKIIQLMQALHPLVGEDGNLMSGGTGASKAAPSLADIMFGDLNKKE